MERFAVTASTGCAASLIGATTLHSCCAIGLATGLAKTYAKRIRSENKFAYDRIRRLRTLVIDEVSMLDGATFDLAGLVVAMVRRDYTADLAANQAPFSRWCNLQIIVCGDFLQLPPVSVVQKGWIFQSKSWQRLAFRNHILTKIQRQQGDPKFAEVLGRARLGRATATDVAYLIDQSAPEPIEGALQLYATNKPADSLNMLRFHNLVHNGAKPHFFSAVDHGPPHFLENCPAPQKLWLCAGARVMCLRNVTSGLANGTLGTVVGVEVFYKTSEYGQHTPEQAGAKIKVRFDASAATADRPFVYSFCTDQAARAVPETDRIYKFSIKEGRREIAHRLQMPLRLAYAP